MSEKDTICVAGYRLSMECPNLNNVDSRCAVNTINAHSWVMADKDAQFRKALADSDVLLPDGEGIVFAARVLAGAKIKKIAGADLHCHLLEQLNESGGKCFYLGSSPSTLGRITDKVHAYYPNIAIDVFSPPFVREFSAEDNERMTDAVNSFAPDVLFVGMTAPKQEKWVAANRDKINARMICSIGAVFDFYAGTKKRPPQWMIDMKLEWFGRLIFDTKHYWRRAFFSIPAFMWNLVKLKVAGKRKVS